MKITPLHAWPDSTAEAKVIQEKFRSKVITSNQLQHVQTVAGIDIGFENNGNIMRAAIVVLSFPELELVEQRVVHDKTRFPYVPGYLSFREVPAALIAFEKLKIIPDLLLCDGQGLAHPRRFGLACHLGLWTRIPSIGVAKSRLIGTHQDVGPEKGNWQALVDGDEMIGAVLRTRTNVSPLYVSIGHLVDLPTAIDYTLRCTTKYRLPETTRWAHKLASG
ncbi:MAG: deoxyribonuclease V [Gammaproteobacteria bacterium]|jgi:deoxyribonuclease V